jgi:hypothetical protein
VILDGDRDELGKYVREIADLVGLRDWVVGVADDTPDREDANAQACVPFGRRAVMIKFSPGWADRDPDELRQTVVHELVHCHLWSLDQRICDLHGIIGSAAYEVLEKAHHENLEHAVDAIALAWSETLPLPIKAKKTRKKAA